jgi:16S rRNA (guanine527-N7)-methyltransferase
VKPGPAELIDVSREARERLEAFVTLLLRWQRTINLISPRDIDALWHRHVLDCLQMSALIPYATKRAVDLGSGAGFPGLVLAIATGVHFDLIESDQRKAAFLQEATRRTGAPATVHAMRIEKARIAAVPLVTARALARLTTLLSWAAPLLAAGGTCLFPKGRGVDDELTDAATRWNMRVSKTPSRTDPAATILRISEISPVQPRP